MIKNKTKKHNFSDQNNLEQFVKEADEKEMIFEKNFVPKTETEDDYLDEKKDLSRKAYIKELKDVIENSDVILF